MAKREMDFLDEMIAEDTAADPEFPTLLAAAEARRRLLRELVAKREEKGLSQTLVAARMRTSQSAVARLEGQDDAKESMIDRYAVAIGVAVERRIVETKPRSPGSSHERPEVDRRLVSPSRSRSGQAFPVLGAKSLSALAGSRLPAEGACS